MERTLHRAQVPALQAANQRWRTKGTGTDKGPAHLIEKSLQEKKHRPHHLPNLLQVVNKKEKGKTGPVMAHLLATLLQLICRGTPKRGRLTTGDQVNVPKICLATRRVSRPHPRQLPKLKLKQQWRCLMPTKTATYPKHQLSTIETLMTWKCQLMNLI